MQRAREASECVFPFDSKRSEKPSKGFTRESGMIPCRDV